MALERRANFKPDGSKGNHTEFKRIRETKRRLAKEERKSRIHVTDVEPVSEQSLRVFRIESNGAVTFSPQEDIL